MESISIGLIGLGHWPKRAYVPSLAGTDEVQVTAVAARSEETRQFARKTFGGDISLFTDYRELLADESIQAVMMALPNPMHADCLAAAASSGKHIFYEPPTGLNAKDVKRALDALSKTDKIVQADLELRCLPVTKRVRELLGKEGIGDPLMAKIRLWCDWGFGGGSFVQDVEQEGFFFWLGCWYLDVLDCIFAAVPVRAEVTGGYRMNGRLMDHGWAGLTYPEGEIGVLEMNLLAVEGLQVVLIVAGTSGELEADLISGNIRWRKEGSGWKSEPAPCLQPVHGFAGMQESIINFISSIREGRKPLADLEVSRRVYEAVLLCDEQERRLRRSVRP